MTVITQVSNDCKAAVFSTKNDTAARFSDIEKKLTDVTNVANTLAHDTKEYLTPVFTQYNNNDKCRYALRADLHSAVQTISSRIANTEKSVATEFGGFNAWKERHEGILHHTDEKIDSMKGGIPLYLFHQRFFFPTS